MRPLNRWLKIQAINYFHKTSGHLYVQIEMHNVKIKYHNWGLLMLKIYYKYDKYRLYNKKLIRRSYWLRERMISFIYLNKLVENFL